MFSFTNGLLEGIPAVLKPPTLHKKVTSINKDTHVLSNVHSVAHYVQLCTRVVVFTAFIWVWASIHPIREYLWVLLLLTLAYALCRMYNWHESLFDSFLMQCSLSFLMVLLQWIFMGNKYLNLGVLQQMNKITQRVDNAFSNSYYFYYYLYNTSRTVIITTFEVIYTVYCIKTGQHCD